MELSLFYKLIPIALQPDGVHQNLYYLNWIHIAKCLRSTTSDCKDIGIGKFEFVAKT